MLMLFCTVCKTSTRTMCGFCYEPYCSIECQMIDWQKHRKVCKPLPALNDCKKFFKDANKNQAVFKQSQNETEESLLINASSDALQESFELLLEKKYIKESDNISEESTEFSMQQIKKEFLKEEGIKFSFHNFVVALLNTKFTIDDLETIHLRLGKSVKVVIIDTTFLESYIVSVMDNEKQSRYYLNDNLTNLSEYCHKYAAERRCYAPKLNEMCLAFYDYDRQWYRAFCIKTLPNSSLLQFVDFGNVVKVLKNNIMPINEEMMFPTCTHMARITNIQHAFFRRFRRYIKQRPQIECDIYFDEALAVYTITIGNLERILDI